MKQIVRIVKNMKKLEQAFQKETLRGNTIKETHVSQSPYDQPYFIAVRDGVEIHFIAYYMKIYNKLKRHWNGKIPDETICKRFSYGYFYRKRAKKTTIWTWLDNLDAKEIARGLVSRGISIDTTACKEALKKRRIAIKDVRKELAGFDPIETAINNWFYSKTEEEQNSIMNYAYKYAAKELNYNGYCNIIVRIYKYDENWLEIKNAMKLTDTIVKDLKQRFNNSNKT